MKYTRYLWNAMKRRKIFNVITVPGEECKNEWCEAVTDEVYEKLK